MGIFDKFKKNKKEISCYWLCNSEYVDVYMEDDGKYIRCQEIGSKHVFNVYISFDVVLCDLFSAFILSD